MYITFSDEVFGLITEGPLLPERKVYNITLSGNYQYNVLSKNTAYLLHFQITNMDLLLKVHFCL